MTEKNYMFLISSALLASRGIANPQYRLEQTRETIESIRKKVPNAHIWVFDSTLPPEDTKFANALQNMGVNSIVRFGDDSPLREMAQKQMHSAGEALSFFNTLGLLQNDDVRSKIPEPHRIFKISGRYTLSDSFEIDAYDDPSFVGKYAFKRLPSYFNPNEQISRGVNSLLITRLWSFCPTLFTDLLQSLPRVIKSCVEENLDLEHSYAKNLDPALVKEVNPLCVQGQIAASLEYVYD